MLNEKAYPKPWEIALSKKLYTVLGIAQLSVLVYIIVLLFSSPIIWTKILILVLLDLAIGFAFKNVVALLEIVKNVDS